MARKSKQLEGQRELFIELATLGVPTSHMKLEDWERFVGVPRTDLQALGFRPDHRHGETPLSWVCSNLSHLIYYIGKSLEGSRRQYGLNRAKMRSILPALEEAWMLVRMGACGDDPWRARHGEGEEEQNDRDA